MFTSRIMTRVWARVAASLYRSPPILKALRSKDEMCVIRAARDAPESLLQTMGRQRLFPLAHAIERSHPSTPLLLSWTIQAGQTNRHAAKAALRSAIKVSQRACPDLLASCLQGSQMLLGDEWLLNRIRWATKSERPVQETRLHLEAFAHDLLGASWERRDVTDYVLRGTADIVMMAMVCQFDGIDGQGKLDASLFNRDTRMQAAFVRRLEGFSDFCNNLGTPAAAHQLRARARTLVSALSEVGSPLETRIDALQVRLDTAATNDDDAFSF